jgi:hypothetical protein
MKVMRSLFFLLAAFACNQCPLLAQEEGPKQPEVLTGWIYEGSAYALQRAPAQVYLLREVIAAGSLPKPRAFRYDLTSWLVRNESLYRWRIRHGCFCGTEDLLPVAGLLRVPMEEMAFALDESEPQPGRPDGTPAPLAKDHRPWCDDLLCLQSGLGIHIPALDAITDRYWKQIGYALSRATGIGPAPVVPGVFVDCLPVSSHRLLLFVLSEKEICAWAADWQQKPDRSKPRVIWSAKPVLRMNADLKERFTVYGTPACLFFLTESGKLYRCRDADKGGQRLKPVWQDDLRHIRVVIGDAVSGKCFAFAPSVANSAAPSVYFEIGEKLDLVSYDPRLPGKANGADVLTTVLGYTRLLIADKKISR